MHKLAFTGLAAGIMMLAPMAAHTAPANSADGTIVIAQREGGGGGMRGGGGGAGPGGGAGAMKGGGGGPAMRGPGGGQRSFDGGGRRGGEGAGRAFRGGNDGVGRVERGDRRGRNIDRGPRQAEPGVKRGNRGPGYGYRGGQKHSRDFVRRRGHRYVWGPGLGFYFYDGYYYGDCDWLERRALATGSAYWWDRYNRCIDW